MTILNHTHPPLRATSLLREVNLVLDLFLQTLPVLPLTELRQTGAV